MKQCDECGSYYSEGRKDCPQCGVANDDYDENYWIDKNKEESEEDDNEFV